jgi:F-type H+-transporting ATPase subunit b
MQVDWFTVVAQIVNFLVLVGLLHRFLYKPIIRAMDAREERIAERLREAEEREQEADQEARAHREKREELERQRDDVLAQAKDQAAKERREMIEDARREVDELQSRWRASLRDQRQSFLSNTRQQAGEQICAVARRVLRDLASERLEAHIVQVFLDRIREMDDQARGEMAEAIQDSEESFTVVTSFDLPDDVRRKVEGTLGDLLADASAVDYARSSDLVCGIELRTGGRKIAWSVDEYLDALSDSLAEALDEESEEDDGE